MNQASLYIHIPFCLKKCSYCDFFSVPSASYYLQDILKKNIFFQSLKNEILTRSKINEISQWNTIYIGGGTPSLLSPEDLSALYKTVILETEISLSSSIEWTIEANPDDITLNWLHACEDIGINRISVGIQSLNQRSLDAVGRRGSVEKNLSSLSLLSKYWKHDLSIDLITGLPYQNETDVYDTINKTISFNPDHISLYSLTIEENTQLAKDIESNVISIPEQEFADDLWIYGRDLLEKNNYRQYEVSNFALSGHQSKHNMTYWNLETYIGVGPGASGTIVHGDTAYRYTNTKNIDEWMLYPGKTESEFIIDRNTFMFETLMMSFRTLYGISRNSFRNRFGCNIDEVIHKTLAKWSQKELLESDQDSINLTADGLLVLNKFLEECLSELS